MDIVRNPDSPEVIIPVSIDLDGATAESVVRDIREQKSRYGFDRFALAGPSAGWRAFRYPPRRHFEKLAGLFTDVKTSLADDGIDLGWWVTTTLKSGPSEEFTRVIRIDGNPSPFANCPLDPVFRAHFASDVAAFSALARPSFIFTEDDFSTVACGGEYGCFCERHLSEFSRREGHVYDRAELIGIFENKTPAGYALLRRWRALQGESLILFAKETRQELDKVAPEIPIGYMQSNGADFESNATEAIARAFAGEKHIPFSRLFGSFYCGGDPGDIPAKMFHAIWSREHLPQPFRYIEEADTFPHTRFFNSAAMMRGMMATCYSHGFDGMTFQTQQLLDWANEEHVYGDMFREERARFTEARRVAKLCRPAGAEIAYDPFANTAERDRPTHTPLWIKAVTHMGIPYDMTSSSVAFLDRASARFLPDADLKKYLSGGVFLDGEAAKILCERGYGEYLGVKLGEDVTSKGTLLYDLGAREVICPAYTVEGCGKNMPSAHMYAVGKNGVLLRMTVTDPSCETVTELRDFRGELVSPAMTFFRNRLGGSVVVMGMTLAGNESQSLFNYRRQRLFQTLLRRCGGDYCLVKEAANVYLIENRAENAEKDGFLGMLTLINLCPDEQKEIMLSISAAFAGAKTFSVLEKDGTWRKIKADAVDDGVILREPLRFLEPIYVLIH